jgi:hypothetical protein
VANTTGSPLSMGISVIGPSPTNRSQRCHSEVMLVSGTGSSRATRIALFNVSAYRNSTSHSCEFSPCSDSRQITASQRALACCSACFHRSPGRVPVCGSRPGSCSISHALTAIACGYPGWNGSRTRATQLTPSAGPIRCDGQSRTGFEVVDVGRQSRHCWWLMLVVSLVHSVDAGSV